MKRGEPPGWDNDRLLHTTPDLITQDQPSTDRYEEWRTVSFPSRGEATSPFLKLLDNRCEEIASLIRTFPGMRARTTFDVSQRPEMPQDKNIARFGVTFRMHLRGQTELQKLAIAILIDGKLASLAGAYRGKFRRAVAIDPIDDTDAVPALPARADSDDTALEETVELAHHETPPRNDQRRESDRNVVSVDHI